MNNIQENQNNVQENILPLQRNVNLYEFVNDCFEKPNKIEYKYETIKNKYNISQSNIHDIGKLIMLGLEYDDDLIIPDYQRELVWTIEQKQKLILSILYGNPIGQFIIKEEKDRTNGDIQVHWTIIDGQQRINALKGFFNGDFCLENGDYFKDLLHWDAREFLFNYQVNCLVVKNISYQDEIELYIRCNTGGTAHTKAEIEKAIKLKEEL